MRRNSALIDVRLPSRLACLEPWVTASVLGPAEVHATDVLTRDLGDLGDLGALDGDFAPVALATACALWAPGHGHVCIDLATVAALVDTERAAAFEATPTAGDPDAIAGRLSRLPWPQLDHWLHALRVSPLVRLVETHDREPVHDDHPLVLWGTLLYTQRQWIDECVVAAGLRSRAAAAPLLPPSAATVARLADLLPPLDGDQPNQQHVAALSGLTSRLTVICGGPGTGKTHTIARLLAVLVDGASSSADHVRIGLAAPTGKAAARMRDALAAAAVAAAVEGAPGELLRRLPAMTVHRLLGRTDSNTRFAHDRDNPLPYDFVIIDEASMVSLPLMARLLDALPPDSHLVLVGDPDQLESIEVGSVLADIVASSSDPTAPLHANVVRLVRPRRLQRDSPIGPLADAVRDNRAADVIAMLRAGGADPGSTPPMLTFIEHDDPLRTADGAGVRDFVVPVLTRALDAARHGDAVSALAALSSVRVLCAHRQGPFGAEQWNRAIETWLLGSPARQRHYPGRAVMLTRNDPRVGLANGDTGVIVGDPDGMRAAFAVGGAVKRFAPARLEDDETAFALTIHRSQGSEYADVVVVLPPATSALIGRELLYTAITRASRRLVVVGTEAAIIRAVESPGRRLSGLAAALSR